MAEAFPSTPSSPASSSSSFLEDRIVTVGSPSGGASGSQGRGRFYEDEDEEGDVCRICRNPGDDENPLRYPCACSGSIKFVHQECLLQWLNHSNARNCEVCKHAFSFSPVYAENAPTRLPLQEFMVGMAMKACHVLQFFVRLAFVISVWLLIIPFITFWIWRLSFVRSLGEAQMLFLSHISAPLILTDCLHGFLLSASIVFIFLGATSLRDYFRNLREFGGLDADREDEANERNGARARRQPGAANRLNVNDGNGDDAGGAQGIAGPGQIVRRPDNIARLEANVEQMFDGLDDADGAEDVPFDELVGMQGPLFHLIENAITVLASNAIFLGVVIFIPFSLGRFVLFYLSSEAPNLAGTSPFMESQYLSANITLNLSESKNEGILGQASEAIVESLRNVTQGSEITNITNSIGRSMFPKNSSGASSNLSDATTLVIGYVFISFLVLAYLVLIASIRYVRGEPVILRRLYGVTFIAEAVPSLFRQFLAGMKHLTTMVKVVFLLVIELGIFPLMCGWWLDICTIKMLGTSMVQRVEFFSFSPLASSLIHWLVGIVYMLQISIFVSLLRGVLRKGVLYFLRDPADPNYNPFRDLIDDPIHKHARRVLLSVVVYGSLIVMLIFLPVKLAMRLAPSIFPLDISVTDPFTEIPADMLLFQICVPFAIEHFKPRETIKFLLHQWFTIVGWVLGLTEYLLPGPEDTNIHDNVNGEVGRRENFPDAPQAGHDLQDHGLMPIAAGQNFDGRVHMLGSLEVAEDSDLDDQADSERYGFVLRIVLLLVLAWMTLLVFNSALIVVPISLGRALFNSLPHLPITHGIKCNDLYAFNIGCYVIWGTVAGIRYAMEYVRTQRAGILMSQIWKWFTIILKSSALLSIWIFIIPVLIGLLFELLVIVPMRVPVDQSPIFLLYQDWALGLIFLKIWTRLVMLDQVALVVDESWRIKFERVRHDGFSGLQGLWVLREIVAPILTKLLTALCVPYVFAKGIFPVFGYPLIVNSAVYRFAWLGCLLISCIYYCAKRFHIWFTNLHNSIRDDRYLIGRRLHNYGEDAAKNESKDEPVDMVDTSSLIPHAPVADVGLRLRLPNAQAL